MNRSITVSENVAITTTEYVEIIGYSHLISARSMFLNNFFKLKIKNKY